MKAQTFLTQVSIGLGVLSLVAVFFAHLALTDIYHGEADVTLEWNIIRAAALVILAFIGLTLLTLGRSLAKRSARS
jgi:hypothetical protein